MGNKNEFTWRPVGFKEVFSLLDLNRYDEILLADLHRTNERINSWLVEVYRIDNNKPTGATPIKSPMSDQPIVPVLDGSDGKGNTGKSLGRMSVNDAKLKFS
jgi:hypothetical protein